MPKSQRETIVWVGTWGVTLDSLFISFIHSIFGSVQFSYSAVFNSSQPHGEQHARHPCPSPTPQACSNSCPSSQWCHQTISFSVIHFSSCLQSLPASGSFPMKRAFRIRWPKYWSFSLSISPSNDNSGLISFRMDCFDLLEVQGTLKCLLQHHSSKASVLQHSAFFILIDPNLCKILC